MNPVTKPLRPLLINSMDLDGGAAIATYRLHCALRQSGIDSTMLVQRKSSSDPSVLGPNTWLERAWARPRRALDQLPVRAYGHRKRQLFSPEVVPDVSARFIRRCEPDLVHLFWITGGFIRPESLPHYGRPIVWTLHDMWPFTGGCHYDAECGRYRSSCGICPQLGSKREADLSRRVWNRKRVAWEDLDMTIVATSRWLARCAGSSALFSRYRIEIIPNCIDISIFKPAAKVEARRACGLSGDKQVILLSAFAATSDPRKGYQHLVPAVRRLVEKGWADKAELVVLGSAAPKEAPDFGMKVSYIPHLSDEQSQVLLYSASDVLVAPSTQENLSNTVLEALACGTPAVAFDVGGMPDLISHRLNGYLARPFEPVDLANGIEWVLDSPSRHHELCVNAREMAVRRYQFKVVAGRYQALYQSLIP